jgi:hypothetical protein
VTSTSTSTVTSSSSQVSLNNYLRISGMYHSLCLQPYYSQLQITQEQVVV